jgi:hypothetical protein
MIKIRRLLFGGQFKRKCQNCNVIRHRAKDRQSKFNQNGVQKGRNNNNFQKNTSIGAYCTYVANQDILREIVSN